jgi:hypothetical protein
MLWHDTTRRKQKELEFAYILLFFHAIVFAKLAWFILVYYLYMSYGRQFSYISKAAACASLLFTLFCSILLHMCS